MLRRVINLKIKDIMTKNVAYVNPDSMVTDAAQLMQKHNIGSIPVCDNSGVIGIVTDRDIVVRNIAHGNNPMDTPVKDVMTSQIKTVTPEMDVRDAATVMSDNKIRRMPVVENNQLVGMVALGDLATNSSFDMEASQALSEISSPSKPEKM